MKLFLVPALILLATATIGRAASDADVSIIKVQKVLLEENTITIVAEAKSRITLIQGDHDPAFKGDTWRGMPVSRVHVMSARGTFIIKRRPDESLAHVWQESLKAARALQEGKEIDRIAFYAPDIVIKGNLIDSINGYGFVIRNLSPVH